MPISLSNLRASPSRSHSHTTPVRGDDAPDIVSPESPPSPPYSHSHSRPRIPFSTSPSLASNAHAGLASPQDFLRPSLLHTHSPSSPNSSATTTPTPSRSASPIPQFYLSQPLSSSASETESDYLPGSPLFTGSHSSRWVRERPRWWSLGHATARRRRRSWGFRTLKRFYRRFLRHPFVPRRWTTILISLLFFTILALSITFLLIRLLDPDKEPLPWKAYCSMAVSSDPPPLEAHPTFLNISDVASAPPMSLFPPPDLDSLPPVGLFVGIFSIDSSFERRMLIRTTWASHPRSREGAGRGDGGEGTSRTVVRFILGQPRKSWERRIRLEMEKYNDIVLLPIVENMNSGKTHVFFSWAAAMAWVPPLYFDSKTPLPEYSYSAETIPAPPLASHDPFFARADQASASASPLDWVRPDFVVKADDDSFVMLAELEARLRVELHQKPSGNASEHSVVHNASVRNLIQPSTVGSEPGYPPYATATETLSDKNVQLRMPGPSPHDDPLIYWGYLVKRRFMAGEMYGLSWSLVDWVSKDPIAKGLTHGAEDKQTAKWMRLHPRASEIRWKSEHCWIYDHPRAGTVYSHGFLFPSEAMRVQQSVRSFFEKTSRKLLGGAVGGPTGSAAGPNGDWSVPAEWTMSTVSKFGTRYSRPIPDLSPKQSVEALVEGSEMSGLHEGSILSAEDAWKQREGRKTRYDDKRVGGTIVVHFIKRHMWFLETALAFLEGEEETPLEVFRKQRGGGKPAISTHSRPVGSAAMDVPLSGNVSRHS